MKSNKSLFLLILGLCLVLAGCDSNPGGLSDEQKLQGSRNARNQQMSQQQANTPTDRNSMPGASNGQ